MCYKHLTETLTINLTIILEILKILELTCLNCLTIIIIIYSIIILYEDSIMCYNNNILHLYPNCINRSSQRNCKNILSYEAKNVNIFQQLYHAKTNFCL